MSKRKFLFISNKKILNEFLFPLLIFSRTQFNQKLIFDRSVFMIIDALRYDFVSAQKMPVLNDLLLNKKGCLLKIKVHPPTVTMPRIKVI